MATNGGERCRFTNKAYDKLLIELLAKRHTNEIGLEPSVGSHDPIKNVRCGRESAFVIERKLMELVNRWLLHENGFGVDVRRLGESDFRVRETLVLSVLMVVVLLSLKTLKSAAASDPVHIESAIDQLCNCNDTLNTMQAILNPSKRALI